jgi:hypothetical protein
MDAKREFAIRYYRWALEQWRLEIDGGFPLLRAIRHSSCAEILEIMSTMSRSERLKMAEILTKWFHPDAVKALGQTLTPEEREMFEHWRHVRARLYRESAEYAACAKPRQKKIAPLRAAIKELVAPVIGKEVEAYRGVLYQYELLIGRWTVVTRVDFTGRADDFVYDHVIRSSADSRELCRVSATSWFGICGGMTAWVGLSDEDIPNAAATLAVVCRRFLDAAPRLLPE